MLRRIRLCNSSTVSGQRRFQSNNNNNAPGAGSRFGLGALSLLRRSIDFQISIYNEAANRADILLRSSGQAPVQRTTPLRPQPGSTVQNAAAAAAGAAASMFPSMQGGGNNQKSFAAFAAAAAAQLQRQQSGQLPQSVENILTELKVRRERIHELNLQLDDSNTQLQQFKTKASESSAMESKLRTSLRDVDGKLVTKSDEVLVLKEKEKELKALQTKYREVQMELAQLKQTKYTESEGFVTTGAVASQLQSREEEIERLKKKIERLRSQSPTMVALSNLCSVVSAQGGETFDHVLQATAFGNVMKKYSSLLTTQWSKHRGEIQASHVLAVTCEEYIRSTLPYATYDCVVEGSLPQEARECLIQRGFLIKDSTPKSCEIYTTKKLVNSLGAYGVVVALQQAGTEIKAFPTICEETIAAGQRTTIEYETTRSSKPGGQAANVTETHVTAKLVLDGSIVVARSECQDTRSQGENTKIAESRLLKEKLPTERKKFLQIQPLLKRVEAQDDDINLLDSGFFDDLNVVERACIRSVFALKE